MTLHSRLKDELIGADYILEEQHRPNISDRDSELLAIGANGSKDKQRGRLPDVSSHIAEDLLALIGEDEAEEVIDDTGEEYPIEGRFECNQLRAEIRLKIRQYCGIREGSDGI